jgi:hypothetical protein
LRTSFSLRGCFFGQLFGGGLDGFNDFGVAGAAAKVSGNGQANFGFAGVRVVIQQDFAGKGQAGGAVTALDGAALNEGLLDGMKLPFAGYAFDGGNGFALRRDGQHQAGIDGSAIDDDGAGAAISGAAAFFVPVRKSFSRSTSTSKSPNSTSTG